MVAVGVVEVHQVVVGDDRELLAVGAPRHAKGEAAVEEDAGADLELGVRIPHHGEPEALRAGRGPRRRRPGTLRSGRTPPGGSLRRRGRAPGPGTPVRTSKSCTVPAVPAAATQRSVGSIAAVSSSPPTSIDRVVPSLEVADQELPVGPAAHEEPPVAGVGQLGHGRRMARHRRRRWCGRRRGATARRCGRCRPWPAGRRRG